MLLEKPLVISKADDFVWFMVFAKASWNLVISLGTASLLHDVFEWWIYKNSFSAQHFRMQAFLSQYSGSLQTRAINVRLDTTSDVISRQALSSVTESSSLIVLLFAGTITCQVIWLVKMLHQLVHLENNGCFSKLFYRKYIKHLEHF